MGLGIGSEIMALGVHLELSGPTTAMGARIKDTGMVKSLVYSSRYLFDSVDSQHMRVRHGPSMNLASHDTSFDSRGESVPNTGQPGYFILPCIHSSAGR
jgi:hypothetical protein